MPDSVVASETAIDCLARDMIEQHGAQAALRVVERVNEQIDQRDWSDRDLWTTVVHATKISPIAQGIDSPAAEPQAEPPRGRRAAGYGGQMTGLALHVV